MQKKYCISNNIVKVLERWGTTSISLGLFVFVTSEPYFVKKRKDEQVAYGSYFTEEWANSLGEWVTGEKSIGNMVLD